VQIHSVKSLREVLARLPRTDDNKDVSDASMIVSEDDVTPANDKINSSLYWLLWLEEDLKTTRIKYMVKLDTIYLLFFGLFF
jgi:hypothetical protein